MSAVTCLDVDAPPGRRSHAWAATGLDIIDGHLCNTRRCVWCQARQHKGYGSTVSRSSTTSAPRTWAVTR